MRGQLGRIATVALIALWMWTSAAAGQDRLKLVPEYDHFQKMRAAIPDSIKPGIVSVTWDEGGRGFEYRKDGHRYRYDIAARKAAPVGGPATTQAANGTDASRAGRRGRAIGVARGRQATASLSPDGKWRAIYRQRNLWLSQSGDDRDRDAIAVTTDGSDRTRIKYATASWAYGEELYQASAMWWSPDSTRIAYYRFDESRVPDFSLQLNQASPVSTVELEAYPKPGDANPIVDLYIYDLRTRKAVRVDVRDGKAFDDSAIGHYVYNVSWSKDGGALLFFRTNRLQNVMEFVAADPQTGDCRAIVREQWPASWVENLPDLRFLADGTRFIWSSERTGFKNFYLYNIQGELLAMLTHHAFEVADIVRADEAHGALFYTARDGDNPMKRQLHRVGLDGAGERRLTDPAFDHTVDVAPDGQHFIDVAQTHDKPPVTWLMDGDGNAIDELARSDTRKFDQLGLKRVELFTFKAADGQTNLYGLLHRPSNFDPGKRYPLLVQVYAGPATNAARETFMLPSAYVELGYLVAAFDARSAAGRGKRALDAIYLKLGQVEIDDQAAGVRALYDRPYVDRSRVGVFGMSYGGFAAAMSLARYPDVFRAACASSPVTDFRNYDSIYSERYMGLPRDHPAAWDGWSVMSYAEQIRGRLMLYYGTADNNVHPNNTMQLVAALQRQGKSFDLQAGPDRGHTPINPDRMMEFFIANLGTVSHPPVDGAKPPL